MAHGLRPSPGRHRAAIGYQPGRVSAARSPSGQSVHAPRGVPVLTMRRVLSFSNRILFSAVLLGVTLSMSTARAQLATDTTQSEAASLTSQQVADLQKVVDRWDDAVGQHDQYALELVLAPQFISISDTGEVGNRDAVVSKLVMKDAPRYTLAQKVVSVRMVGDVAVVNGTYDRTYQGSRLSRTKAKEQKGVFSQVYIRARNSWQCINSQRTIIVEMAVGGKKKSKDQSTEKPLNHDLGFHFPGVHHSSSTDSQPPQ